MRSAVPKRTTRLNGINILSRASTRAETVSPNIAVNWPIRIVPACSSSGQTSGPSDPRTPQSRHRSARSRVPTPAASVAILRRSPKSSMRSVAATRPSSANLERMPGWMMVLPELRWQRKRPDEFQPVQDPAHATDTPGVWPSAQPCQA